MDGAPLAFACPLLSLQVVTMPLQFGYCSSAIAFLIVRLRTYPARISVKPPMQVDCT